MHGKKLLQVDRSVAVLVELLGRLRNEDGRAPLGADLREDEVLELVLSQNLQSATSCSVLKICPRFRETGSRNLRHCLNVCRVPVTVGVCPLPAIPLPPLVLVSVVQPAWVDDGLKA